MMRGQNTDAGHLGAVSPVFQMEELQHPSSFKAKQYYKWNAANKPPWPYFISQSSESISIQSLPIRMILDVDDIKQVQMPRHRALIVFDMLEISTLQLYKDRKYNLKLLHSNCNLFLPQHNLKQNLSSILKHLYPVQLITLQNTCN